MDPALQRTLEALFDASQVEWSSTRPDPGQEPKEQELFIGVGARADDALPHPRMIAWKLPQWRKVGTRSSTEAALRSAAALDALGATLRREPGLLATPVQLRTHEPTLDTLTAAIFTVHRLLWGAWPGAAAELREFVSEWEQGRIEAAGSYQKSLASVFYAMLGLWKPDEGKLPRENVELLGAVLDHKLTRVELGNLAPELIPGRVSRRLKADSDLYRAELSRARLVQLDLPLDTGSAQSTAHRRVDAMFLSSSQDVTVLKLLARPDIEHSSYQQGFDLLAVHAPHERQAYARHTISLAPERSGTLDDLAAVLDQREGETSADGAPRDKSRRRFPNQPNEYADPWYSDGYAWPRGRSTIVAPPFKGTRLTREEIWEAIWERFNVGRNIKVASALTVFVRPYRLKKDAPLGPAALLALGFKRSALVAAGRALLTPVAESFLGDEPRGDIDHFERAEEGGTLHLSLYPNDLVLIWRERAVAQETPLFSLAQEQAKRVREAAPVSMADVLPFMESLVQDRWMVFGAYRLDRGRSSMLDGSRSVLGLLHALASGNAPTLHSLPSAEAVESRKVFRDSAGDVEHWFTSTGGARVELVLEPAGAKALAIDHDFLLFLLTTGQRYTVFEITRRMSDVERRARTSRWQSLRPTGDVRGDVMFFTNSLWYSRVSDDPDLNARYLAWNELHGMNETVDAMRDQTAELDAYRKERFENMVGVMVFVFLPITIACGFFSGAQFSELDLKVGLPWSTGGWIVFLLYVAFFTVLVFGTYLLGKVFSWRRR